MDIFTWILLLIAVMCFGVGTLLLWFGQLIAILKHVQDKLSE